MHNPPLDQGALDAKLHAMRDRIAACGSVAVAFSAGVDSTFVLRVALEVLGPDRVLAVTSRSPSVPRADLSEAARLAGQLGVEQVWLDTEEFDNANYTANPNNRCYFCKQELYSRLQPLLAGRGLDVILNGTNADDLGDYRPGLQAAAEYRVVAPAADAGLTKAEIRVLSRRLGLPTADKPASPCLSSRVPYGHEVTPAKLRAIESAESFLRAQYGIRECRVRHYGSFARVEVPLDDVARLVMPAEHDRLAEEFRAFGFARVEVDPRGFRSGSLNEVIAFGRAQVGPVQLSGNTGPGPARGRESGTVAGD